MTVPQFIGMFGIWGLTILGLSLSNVEAACFYAMLGFIVILLSMFLLDR